MAPGGIPAGTTYRPMLATSRFPGGLSLTALRYVTDTQTRLRRCYLVCQWPYLQRPADTLPTVKPSEFEVGERYDIDYVNANLTSAGLEAALLVRVRPGPAGEECVFRREDGWPVVIPAV